MSILYANFAWCEHEEWGVRLFSQMAALVRDLDVLPDCKVPPTGPHFDYDRSPFLFLGRRGIGPLHIAWDTNLLIDYFDHGYSLWEARSMPDLVAGEHGDDLEALQIVLALWVVRDIRFHIAPGVIRDSKRKPLSDVQSAERRQAFDRFIDAVSLAPASPLEWGEEGTPQGPLVLPESELQRALRAVPEGNDRLLVRHAINHGLHLFMTRDKGILESRDSVRPFGLIPATPGDVLELLAGAGALHCMLAPRYLTWPMPDQHRVAHLMHSLGFRD